MAKPTDTKRPGGKARPAQPGRSSRKARQAEAERRRRRTRAVGIGGVVLVLVFVLLVVVVSLLKPKPSSQPSEGAGAAGVGVQQVPESTLSAVGAGSGVTPPMALPANTPPLTADGKPQVLYVGADYCPFCAAERWPLILALSRFGSFENLGATTSSASDVFPNTQTFSFHGSTYTSDYLSFDGVETQTNTGQALDQPSAAQQALFQQYDTAPYTSTPGAIPFLMIGNRYVSVGASYDPSILQGMTRDQIVAALSDPSSPVAASVDGAANTITAALCQTTGGKPASVCSSPTIAQVATTLPPAR
jgi:uncharacterized protein DUF929